MGFHSVTVGLDEYRYELNQTNKSIRVVDQLTDRLLFVDQEIDRNNKSLDSSRSSSSFRLTFDRLVGRSIADEREEIKNRLIEIEHCRPDILIRRLMENGDFGEALRVCQVFERIDLSDEIHERQVRCSSRQIEIHLSKIRDRFRIVLLAADLIYPTIDEQYRLFDFTLNKVLNRSSFDELSQSDEPIFRSIEEETRRATVVDRANNVQSNGELNPMQKKFLFFRRRIIELKRKLILLDQMINEIQLFDQFDIRTFDLFRRWNNAEIGRRCARVRLVTIGVRSIRLFVVLLNRKAESTASVWS